MATGPKVVPGREGRRAPPKDGIERRGRPPASLTDRFSKLTLPLPEPGSSTNATIRYNLAQAASHTSVEKRLIELIESPDDKVALQAMKLFYDVMMVKENESKVLHGELKPQIFLPEQMPDPAKVVNIK